MTRAVRRAPSGAVRGQDPPKVNFATHSKDSSGNTCAILGVEATARQSAVGEIELTPPWDRALLAAFRLVGRSLHGRDTRDMAPDVFICYAHNDTIVAEAAARPRPGTATTSPPTPTTSPG